MVVVVTAGFIIYAATKWTTPSAPATLSLRQLPTPTTTIVTATAGGAAVLQH